MSELREMNEVRADEAQDRAGEIPEMPHVGVPQYLFDELRSLVVDLGRMYRDDAMAIEPLLGLGKSAHQTAEWQGWYDDEGAALPVEPEV